MADTNEVVDINILVLQTDTAGETIAQPNIAAFMMAYASRFSNNQFKLQLKSILVVEISF